MSRRITSVTGHQRSRLQRMSCTVVDAAVPCNRARVEQPIGLSTRATDQVKRETDEHWSSSSLICQMYITSFDAQTDDRTAQSLHVDRRTPNGTIVPLERPTSYPRYNRSVLVDVSSVANNRHRDSSETTHRRTSRSTSEFSSRPKRRSRIPFRPNGRARSHRRCWNRALCGPSPHARVLRKRTLQNALLEVLALTEISPVRRTVGGAGRESEKEEQRNNDERDERSDEHRLCAEGRPG